MEFIYPDELNEGTNESSLAFRLDYGEFAAQFTEVGVIQVGADNSYGHPTQEVLSRLQAQGIEIYRTDLHGEITVTTDGRVYRVKTESSGTAGPPVPVPGAEVPQRAPAPTPEPEPVPAPAPSGEPPPGGLPQGDLDCSDFDTQAEAQTVLDADPSDPHGLDAE